MARQREDPKPREAPVIMAIEEGEDIVCCRVVEGGANLWLFQLETGSCRGWFGGSE